MFTVVPPRYEPVAGLRAVIVGVAAAGVVKPLATSAVRATNDTL